MYNIDKKISRMTKTNSYGRLCAGKFSLHELSYLLGSFLLTFYYEVAFKV